MIISHVAICVVCCFAQADGNPGVAVNRIVGDALRTRREINSYEIVINVTSTVGKVPPSRFHIWRESDRERVDRFYDFDKDRFARSITCYNCPKHGQHFRNVYPRERDPKVIVAGRIADMATGDVRFPHDPRLDIIGMGILPEGLFVANRSVDKFMMTPPWRLESTQELLWHDKPAVKYTYAAGQGQATSTGYIIVCAESGPEPVATCVEVFRGPDELFSWSVESKLERVANTKFWLPVECRYRMETNNSISSSYSATIEYRSMNGDIEDRVFSLAGMDLAVDTYLGVPSKDVEKANDGVTTYKWDGKDVVPATNITPKRTFASASPTPTPAQPSRRLLLISLSVACMLIALVLIVKSRRR